MTACGSFWAPQCCDSRPTGLHTWSPSLGRPDRSTRSNLVKCVVRHVVAAEASRSRQRRRRRAPLSPLAGSVASSATTAPAERWLVPGRSRSAAGLRRRCSRVRGQVLSVDWIRFGRRRVPSFWSLSSSSVTIVGRRQPSSENQGSVANVNVVGPQDQNTFCRNAERAALRCLSKREAVYGELPRCSAFVAVHK